jgi:basic amino acid/polyamine antiporter, APA family
MDALKQIDPRYARILGLKDLILLGLSMTIGSGVFVLVDDVAKYSQQLMWLSMLTAGVSSLCTAMSYGELASLFQNNMGEYGYFTSVADQKTANVLGGGIMLSDIMIIATIALGLCNYLNKMSGCPSPLWAIIPIIVLNVVNYYGIKVSAQASHGALYLKLGIIGLIVLCSFWSGQPQENMFDFSNVTTHSFTKASIIALFAYLGFNNLTNFTEETKNPETNIGRSIVYTVGLSTVIYTVLMIACLWVMSSKDLSQTTTPLAEVIKKLFGSYGYLMFMVLAVVSLIDTLLVTSVSESRYIHAFLSRIFPSYGEVDMDKKHHTPYLSILLLVIMASIVILCIQNIETTAIWGDLLIMVIFLIVNVITIVLRYRSPETQRAYKIPFNWGKIPIPSVIAIIIQIYAIFNFFAGA